MSTITCSRRNVQDIPLQLHPGLPDAFCWQLSNCQCDFPERLVFEVLVVVNRKPLTFIGMRKMRERS